MKRDWTRRRVVALSAAALIAPALVAPRTASAQGQGLLARLQASKKVRVGIANQPPFSWDWDTSRVGNSQHLIEIRGADDKGTIVNTVLTKVIEEATDVWSFLFAQLGLEP